VRGWVQNNRGGEVGENSRLHDGECDEGLEGEEFGEWVAVHDFRAHDVVVMDNRDDGDEGGCQCDTREVDVCEFRLIGRSAVDPQSFGNFCGYGHSEHYDRELEDTDGSALYITSVILARVSRTVNGLTRCCPEVPLLTKNASLSSSSSSMYALIKRKNEHSAKDS
jgi:hypothetical protein